MLKRLISRFKTKFSSEEVDENRLQKKVQVDYWLSGLQHNWNELESVLFWKDARISSATFVVITVFFWKFISWRLQKLSASIILISVASAFPAVRKGVSDFLVTSAGFKFKNENRRLCFTYNDLADNIVNAWEYFELWQEYLTRLHYQANHKFWGIICSLVTPFLLVLLYVPIAEVLYTAVLICYFAPILYYMGLGEKIVEKFKKLGRPILVHWEASQTKRKRNRSKAERRILSIRSRQYSSDSDEEFSLDKSHLTDQALEHALPKEHDETYSSMNESFDELELRPVPRHIKHVPTDCDLSEEDEDPFLPSEPSDSLVMPSLSNFDSMMEPLDEFHNGLNFKNLSVQSLNRGPSNVYYDTDDDLDDLLPLDHTDSRVQGSSQSNTALRQRSKDRSSHSGVHSSTPNIDVDLRTRIQKRLHTQATSTRQAHLQYQQKSAEEDQEYEILDRSELSDITDEEIQAQLDQQSNRHATTSRELLGGVVGASKSAVSSLLGYNKPKGD